MLPSTILDWTVVAQFVVSGLDPDDVDGTTLLNWRMFDGVDTDVIVVVHD